MKLIDKPHPGEYSPHAIAYINLLPNDKLVLHHLQSNFAVVKKIITRVPEEKLYYRYSPGKWTIKETLVHIMDDERIYAYRTLRIARNDKTPLPGFDQDDYVPFSRANERSVVSIFDEYKVIRQSTILLFDSFSADDLLRTGVANNHTMSVRAAAYHIAGHELHHLNIIQQKYL